MKKITALRLAGIPAVLLASAGSVMAAVPAEITTAMGDMKTDAIAIASAVLLAIIAVAAIKFLRKGF